MRLWVLHRLEKWHAALQLFNKVVSARKEKMEAPLLKKMTRKALVVLIDGLGDNSVDGKTPLEMAKTPNMDFLASRD